MEKGSIPKVILLPQGFGKRFERLIQRLVRPDDAYVLDDELHLFWPEKPQLFTIAIHGMMLDKELHVKCVRFHVGPFARSGSFIRELRQWASFLKENLEQNEVVAFFDEERCSYSQPLSLPVG